MNAQHEPSFNFPTDDAILLSAVTVIDRDALESADREERAQLWLSIHQSTRARLVTSVARFYLAHHNVTIHDEPAYSVPDWEGNPDAVAYVLSAMAYRHHDLSHLLAEPEDYRAGEWIRLHTKCGCESRTMRYPAPLPQTIHKSAPGTGNGVRTFRKGTLNAFGATTYNEV